MAARALEPGETLIAQGDALDTLYELRSGTLEILSGSTLVRVEAEPGALLGEMSLLLDQPASATVRARTEAVVVEVANARERLASDPDFTMALARLLARRLDSLTGYLADLRRQYSDHDGGLGMIDEVLASLAHATPIDIEPGSEREPDAPY
ncbi:MAG: family transcriptional regulator, cyclic receptor protein [Acidimicrobiaceae bacterium]|jgi:CRP-like cAMP-binding protein